MKKNKKAIVGFALAMVTSMAFMQSMAHKSATQNSDVNKQQISIGAGYMAGSSEGGKAGAWTAASALAGGAAIAVGYGALTNAWNPLGWVGGAVAGGLAL